jgi:hypothetical protein
MSATLTINQSWTDGKRLHVVGAVSLTGNYVAGGMSFSLLDYGLPTSAPIVHSDVVGKGGYYGYDIGTLYEYRYLQAPAQSAAQNPLANGVLRIYFNGTELSAGALPAGVSGDRIFFYGIFQKY